MQQRADGNRVSAVQTMLDEIFATADRIRDCPLVWDDQIIRQMIECVKVIGKEKLIFRFRWGAEAEAVFPGKI